MSWPVTTLAVLIPTAKQIPWAGRITAVFTPITRPRPSTRGPPELPGFKAASVWITSSMRRPVTARNERPTALVAERDVDLRRIVDHVAVRENEPVGRKHESRAVTGNLSRRASPPLHPTPHFHTDDRRTNSLRRPRHRL